MLAHKGFEEGIAVAELIAGLPGHVNYDTIPNVIYTEPEVAWVGRTEQQLKEDGTPYKTGSFPFAALGRAVAMAEPAGFVKVIAHAETDRVLGLHLVGVGVSELVHEGVLTMEFKGSADDLARICHAYPTLSESIHDAAMSVDKRASHKRSDEHTSDPHTIKRLPYSHTRSRDDARPISRGRAGAMAKADGFVKMSAHAETDRVLGLHLVGVGVA